VRTRLIDLTDRLVIGGLVVMIMVTPLCFATVHPWAYHAAEAVIFAMLAAALLRMRAAEPPLRGVAEILGIAAPAAALVLLIGFQLLPLPPSAIRVLSPTAYDFYRHTLQGWPARIEIPKPTAQPAGSLSSDYRPVVMPTENEVREGAAVPFTPKPLGQKSFSPPVLGRPPRNAGWYDGVWRSLSLSPVLGISSALKLLAGFALFGIVALYPVARDTSDGDEDHLTRLLMGVALISGITVAVIGILQQVTWNGKVLWFYVPLDWGAPNPNPPRMMGPFIDPDHFAAYLAMTVPLFISRAWTSLAGADREGRDGTVSILCSTALVVLACAILLSQSRAIWGAMIVSCAIFAILASRIGIPSVFRTRAHGPRAWVVGFGLAALALAGLAIALVGSAGRGQIDTRIGQSVAGGIDFWHRVHIWHDTLRMVRDFPIFGVGFGSWAEVFPHFQRGPWPAEFLRHAHNDYVELSAELGIAGVAALAMIGWKLGRLIWQRWEKLTPRAQLTAAGLISGMAVEGFHELFDFSLTVPAVGFLFAIYAALLVRIAVCGVPETKSAARGRRLLHAAGPVAAVAALALIVASQVQASVIYPYYPRPVTFADARTMVLLHPANAGLHLALASRYGNSPPGLAQVAQAVWIDPRNPYARDLYALFLSERGQYLESLDQVTLSVMWSPSLSDHLYLAPRIIPYLGAPDRKAIERGLEEAVARAYPEAVGTLGAFYSDSGQTLDAARVYEQGAATARDAARRYQLLMLAGQAYQRLGNLDAARRDYEAARFIDPQNPEPYSALTSQVFGPRKQVAEAESLLRQGLDAGADPAPLFAEFARVAEAAGQRDKARAALKKMVEYDPSYDNLLRLGSYYLATHNYARASETFRRTTDIDPHDPRGWLNLATAEEDSYQYVAANGDYERAVALDPHDAGIHARFAAFKRKLAAGGADAVAPVSPPAPVSADPN
jgi:O-antigen ligase/tetratricopeptide (TPR) repeat protein